MKYSSIARARHLAARRVTLNKHQYSVFATDPSFTLGGDRGSVMVQGKRQTGTTTTLRHIACQLMAQTPSPIKDKRHLMLVRTDATFADWFTPKGLDETKKVDSALFKKLAGGLGFDIMVCTPDQTPNFDATKYEVIHEVCDYNWPFVKYASMDHPGVKCMSAAPRTSLDDAPAKREYLNKLSVPVVLETVLMTNGQGEQRMKVRIEKYLSESGDAFIGKEFMV